MKRKIEEKLLQWKNKTKDRKPLILNGARQVGKTYLLREFGEKYYKNTVYVNLEISREVRAYFEENLEPERNLLGMQLKQYYEQLTAQKEEEKEKRDLPRRGRRAE